MNTEKVIELAKRLRESWYMKQLRKDTMDGVSAVHMARDFDRLLDLIDPPEVKPEVDWTKPIQRRDGQLSARLLSTINAMDGRNRVVEFTDESGIQAVYLYQESGSVGLRGDHERDIINVPAPAPPAVEEVEYEVAVAQKDGWKEQVAWKTSSGRIHIEGLLKPHPSLSVAEKDGWTFGTWHRQKVQG